MGPQGEKQWGNAAGSKGPSLPESAQDSAATSLPQIRLNSLSSGTKLPTVRFSDNKRITQKIRAYVLYSTFII